MSYVEKILTTNEKILARTRQHFFILFGRIFKEILILAVLIVGYIAVSNYLQPDQIFFFRIAFAVVAVIVLITMLVDFLRWSNEEYLVTTRRVIHSHGVMSKKVLDSSLSKINDVVLEQSWLGRLMNYGTIRILTASDEVINALPTIYGPIAFKHAMLEAKAQFEPLGGVVTAAPVVSPTQLLEELAKLKERGMITEEEFQEKRKEILKRI
jgi:uncharacterized membrane protein YdbT with pleckstrin-like domain